MSTQTDSQIASTSSSGIRFKDRIDDFFYLVSFIVFKVYLLLYYVACAVRWNRILLLTLSHLIDADGTSDAFYIAGDQTASSFIAFAMSSTHLPQLFRILGLLPTTLEWRLPSKLRPFYRRSTTVFARVGTDTALHQTLALCDVVFSLVDLAETPLKATVLQVSSRLFLVWGIVEQFPQVRSNPLYSSMVLAWSWTETMRYWFYAVNVIGLNPRILRYSYFTAFYLLYPIGALSEAFLIYDTLPRSSPIPGRQSWFQGTWTLADYMRGALFMIWWPGVVYTIVQWRKVLGKAPRINTKFLFKSHE